jgi:outer membrane immunogenic protein
MSYNKTKYRENPGQKHHQKKKLTNMKKIFLLIVLFTFATFSQGQSPLPLKRTQLNFGVGLSGWGVPVYAGFDYSVHKDITLGAEFSWRSYRENWKTNYYNHRIIGISGNANYHFNSVLQIPQNWDFYAGLNLGFFVWSSPSSYPGDYRSGLGLGGQVGGRYYFTDRFGVNLEFGGGNAFYGGKFGITLKI